MDDCKTEPDDPGRAVAEVPDHPESTTSALHIPSPSRSFAASPLPPSTPLSPTSKADLTIPPSPKTTSAPPSEDVTTKILRFFSNATPESLGAVGVGLAATTYFVLGRVGLVLMGAFGGIALFVAWEARNPEVSRAVKGETGSETLRRVLDYRQRDAQQQGETAADRSAGALIQEQELAHAFDSFRPETRQALDDLVDAVIRDYVKWWYTPIVPYDRSFPLSCRRVLTSFLVTVSNHLSRKRPADAFLDFLTNSSSIVIVLFSELTSAFAEQTAQQTQQQQQQQKSGSSTSTPLSAADVVYNYLAANPDSNLANLLSQQQQASKLRMVAEDLLGFLDRQTYEHGTAHTFLREIMASAVLETTLQTCSKPEWINGWIVYLLEAGEPDFSQAIDVGMQTRADAAAGGASSSGSGSSNVADKTSAAYFDIDGNVGNIALTKGHRTSLDMERVRRKESMVHRKQLSRAEEEMEEAMEEMKRMNQMIADEEAARRAREVKRAMEAKTEAKSTTDPEKRLTGAMEHALEIKPLPTADKVDVSEDSGLVSPSVSDRVSPKQPSSVSGDEGRQADGTVSPNTPRSSSGGSPSQPSFGKPEPEAAAAAASTEAAGQQFTSFDQLVPPVHEEEDTSDTEKAKPAPLTLHNATVTIHDEPVSDKGRIKSKPTWDFLIQIEPANSHYPGWMIVRKYGDFEKLHEVLRRIATISGATAFTEQHGVLPAWKVHTRGSLRGELERYVRDACWYAALAESEGMKRFLEKDTNNMPARSRPGAAGLQAFEAMGKNVLDVLTSAPKGVAEGGKVVVGGVTGVLGNFSSIGSIGSSIGSIGSIGGMGLQRKHTSAPSVTTTGAASTAANPPVTTPTSSVLQDVTAYTNRLSISTPPRTESSSRRSRDSLDSQRSSVVSAQPGRPAPMERRPSFQAGITGENESGGGGDSMHSRRSRSELWEYTGVSHRSGGQHSQHNSRASSLAGFPRSPSTTSLSGPRLPRSDIFDDNVGRMSPLVSPNRLPPAWKPPTPATSYTKQWPGITEAETRVAVELLFAVINELYTLSSAWNIRRTLLTAAKSFLLRPGNPSLVSIQSLLQTSVLDAHTADASLAASLRKLRENTLPTEAEQAAWPPELTAEDKEKLRIKARRLLIASGVPAALTGVMGQTATADALGRIFDCLQVEEVARGLMFGLILQAARVVTH